VGHEDGGYLTAILDACRHAVAGLPSFGAVAPTVRGAAARIVDFQALNLGEADRADAAAGHGAGRRRPTRRSRTACGGHDRRPRPGRLRVAGIGRGLLDTSVFVASETGRRLDLERLPTATSAAPAPAARPPASRSQARSPAAKGTATSKTPPTRPVRAPSATHSAAPSRLRAAFAQLTRCMRRNGVNLPSRLSSATNFTTRVYAKP
jgi:hypothetical protein